MIFVIGSLLKILWCLLQADDMVEEMLYGGILLEQIKPLAQFFLKTCLVVLSVCPVSAVSAVSCDVLEPSGLMSPSSTVRCLTKDLQHSLDLASATSGDKVVTAQVSVTVDRAAWLLKMI